MHDRANDHNYIFHQRNSLFKKTNMMSDPHAKHLASDSLQALWTLELLQSNIDECRLSIGPVPVGITFKRASELRCEII